MRWSEFLERRAARLERVRAALEDPSRRADALVGWRFGEDPAAAAAVYRALDALVPAPPPALLALALAPPEALPPPPPSGADADEPLHRLRIARAFAQRLPPAAEVPASPASHAAWALEHLVFIGEQVEARERAAWAREQYDIKPLEDQAVSQLWARVFAGGAAVWGDQKRWEALCLPAATASFRQVLSTRELPPGVAKQALTELRDGFWFQFLGGKGGVPGWAEIAARVVESLGGLPGLTLALDDGEWAIATGCASVRGAWPDSLAALLPDIPGGPARALKLRQRLGDRPDLAEVILDAHVALRLLETWSAPDGTDPVRSWGVVVQNRGRARGRLRALAMTRPAALRPLLLSLEALHSRTLAAVRRYAWDWAWESMARGFAWDFSNPVTPPCEPPEVGLEPLDPSEHSAARTWVLLVVLKGRLDHLQRWVQTGGTGDRDGTWGRLLSDELPATLRDPPPADPGRGRVTATYHRLRAWLADSLEPTLARWRPVLQAVGALPENRTLARSMEALLRPCWDERVPFPKAGFPTFQSHAVAAVAASEPAL